MTTPDPVHYADLTLSIDPENPRRILCAVAGLSPLTYVWETCKTAAAARQQLKVLAGKFAAIENKDKLENGVTE